MGPNALFDKSFLQSLSVDEAMWFDIYFNANICPLFYVETLADLGKRVTNRSAEDEVRIIASKTPVMGGYPCAHHTMMVGADLNGRTAAMTGQIPIANGRIVQLGEKRGAVYDESDEGKAFNRWQRGEFRELEHEFARGWRKALSEMDLAGAAETLRPFGIDGKTCKSFEAAKQAADALLDSSERPIDQFRLALSFLGIPPQVHDEIVFRWGSKAFPPLRLYAPYARHVAGVEAFLYVALAARLVSDQRPNNRTDIAYLFYLPFCMLFVSSDRLHERSAPHFLRPDQQFVWGLDLKKDLGEIDQHFRKLPEEVKEKGVQAFAAIPPEGSLVHKIWSRHFPGWQERRSESSPVERDPVKDKELIGRLKEFTEAPEVSPEAVDTGDLDMISIQRKVTKRRGSWWQLPKDLKEGEE